MRDKADGKTVDMFPPKVRAVPAHHFVTPDEKSERRKLREEQEAARRAKRRWVIVFHPGTDDQEEGPRFAEYTEAVRLAPGCGVPYDIMLRREDGTLTTEF